MKFSPFFHTFARHPVLPKDVNCPLTAKQDPEFLLRKTEVHNAARFNLLRSQEKISFKNEHRRDVTYSPYFLINLVLMFGKRPVPVYD